MQQAETHQGHPATLGEFWTPPYPCRLTDWLLLGAGRRAFSLHCIDKRIHPPRYCYGVLNNSTEIIKLWKILWHALYCWRCFMYIVGVCAHTHQQRALWKSQTPQRSRPPPFESRGCFLNSAEKWLLYISLHVSSCCKAKKSSICIIKKRAWPQAMI